MPESKRPREDETIAQLIAQRQLEPAMVAEARDQARRWKTSIGEVLMAQGAISHRDWAVASATSSGLPLADLMTTPPTLDLLDRDDQLEYLRLGVLPWRRNGEQLILAARYPGAPEVVAWAAARYPGRPIGWAVTTKFDILWALQQRFDVEADHAARESLFLAAPALSAKYTFTRQQCVVVWVCISLLMLGLFLAPLPTAIALSGVVTLFYVLSSAFRFLLTWIGAHHEVDISVTPEELAALRPEDLPVFTVLVPMYPGGGGAADPGAFDPPAGLSARQARREAGAGRPTIWRRSRPPRRCGRRACSRSSGSRPASPRPSRRPATTRSASPAASSRDLRRRGHARARPAEEGGRGVRTRVGRTSPASRPGSTTSTAAKTG